MAEQSGWAVLGLVGVGVAAWWLLRDDKSGTSGDESEEPETKDESGWYAIWYDRLDEPKYRGKGRWKGYDGPFDTKSEAEEAAKEARKIGWNRKANARTAVSFRKKAPA